MSLTHLLLVIFVGYCYGCPDIVKRAEWGARNPIEVSNLRQNPAPFIIVHHSATKTCTTSNDCQKLIKSIQNHHMDQRDFKDIGYNFLIGGNGVIYQGRGWGKHGAHATSHNSKSVGICLLGDFSNSKPTTAQENALKSLIKCAEDTGKVSKNYQLLGHKQVKSTTCPGSALYNIINKWPHFHKGKL